MIRKLILTVVACSLGVINVRIEQRKLNPNKNKIWFYRILVSLLVLLQIYQILKTI